MQFVFRFHRGHIIARTRIIDSKNTNYIFSVDCRLALITLVPVRITIVPTFLVYFVFFFLTSSILLRCSSRYLHYDLGQGLGFSILCNTYEGNTYYGLIVSIHEVGKMFSHYSFNIQILNKTFFVFGGI